MHSDTFPQPDVWMEHRVSYGETDAMGYVYHAEYLHIFERSRNAYIRFFGMSYADVETQGYFLPVREAWCRYRRPARYDDLVQVRIGIQSHGRASLRFAYQLYSEDRLTLLAEGYTEHACTNREGRPVRLPEPLLALCADDPDGVSPVREPTGQSPA